MSRKILVLLFFVAAAGLVVFFGWSRDVSSFATSGKSEEKRGNQLLISHTEIFGRLERPKVLFDHRKHSEALKKEGCKACHPAVTEEDLLFEFPFNVAKKDKDSIMNAYHEKCITCHQNNLDRKKKAGPVTCGECHVKKSELLKVSFPVVEFDFYFHDTHVKKLREKLGKDDCSLCHHTYDIEEKDESLALVYEKGTEESCYYCHDLEKKRGPELTAINRVAAKKGLDMQRASHTQCLNCHLKYEKELELKKERKKDEKAGPTECMKCHTGKYRTIAELEKVPRPDRGQKETALINIENAKMKSVALDHKSHEKNNKTCRGCHHETLNPPLCKECHTLGGSFEGLWGNLANAYHDPLSEISCAGCHNLKKAEKNCAGCHGLLPVMDIQTRGPSKDTCDICHTGKKELLAAKPLSVAGLDREKVKKEVTIKVLEREYEPAKFPHMKIIEGFVKISNDSKLGSYFHMRLQTICDGCHHQSRANAEVEKDSPPYCRNCHGMTFDRQNRNKPKLIAAYHGQCMGCHNYMKLEKARKCEECHKKKAVRPAYPLEPERIIIR